MADTTAFNVSDLVQKGGDFAALKPKNPAFVKTGIVTLDSAFQSINLKGQWLECGAPPGKMGRVLPGLIANSFQEKCLWVTDSSQLSIYAKFFDCLGLNLENFFFLHSSDPLRAFKTVLCENTFRVVLFDSGAFLSKAI